MLESKIKYWIKYFLGAFHIRRKAKRPILLFSTHAKEAIHQKNPSDLLRRWSNQVTPAEAGEAMQLINELLGIHVYRWDSPFPIASLCHFGPLDA